MQAKPSTPALLQVEGEPGQQGLRDNMRLVDDFDMQEATNAQIICHRRHLLRSLRDSQRDVWNFAW